MLCKNLVFHFNKNCIFFLFLSRPAILFVHGTLDWDKFHIMISRSTTPDLLKMAAKLEEFFTTYLTNSKRVLSAFGPIGGSMKSKSSTKRKNSEDLGMYMSRCSFWFQSRLWHIYWCLVLTVCASAQFIVGWQAPDLPDLWHRCEYHFIWTLLHSLVSTCTSCAWKAPPKHNRCQARLADYYVCSK